MFLQFNLSTAIIIIMLINLKITFLDAIQNGNDMQYDIEVIRHNPCHYIKGYSKWNRSLEFESGNGKKGPQLKRQPNKPGCYIIGGRTNVLREFRANFSVYVEIRTFASRQKPAEPCINQQSDGCGGLGSWFALKTSKFLFRYEFKAIRNNLNLYCNTCNDLDSTIGLKAELLNNGVKLKCNTRLSPGIYNSIQLAFCLPELDEILKAHGLNRETFLSLLETESGDFIRKLGIFITVYIFNTDVSMLMQAQSRLLTAYKDSRKALFKNEPLPSELYWSLPFNAMIKNEKLYVACHIIHCNINIIA